jgi:hypothetical protein
MLLIFRLPGNSGRVQKLGCVDSLLSLLWTPYQLHEIVLGGGGLHAVWSGDCTPLSFPCLPPSMIHANKDQDTENNEELEDHLLMQTLSLNRTISILF